MRERGQERGEVREEGGKGEGWREVKGHTRKDVRIKRKVKVKRKGKDVRGKEGR